MLGSGFVFPCHIEMFTSITAGICVLKYSWCRPTSRWPLFYRISPCEGPISVKRPQGQKFQLLTTQLLNGLQGVENVYTQHTPHLSQTLEHILRGKLKETSYPFIESPGPNASLQRCVIVSSQKGLAYFLLMPIQTARCYHLYDWWDDIWRSADCSYL